MYSFSISRCRLKVDFKCCKSYGSDGNETTVIMITAYGTIERAVHAMKHGAYDFITKPFDLDHISLVVEKALERERLKSGLEHFTEEAGERYRLVGGESPKMREAVDTAKKAAISKSTVLLLGESGTGKEVFARAIHNWSERKGEPFIAINCVGLGRNSWRASFSATKRAHLPERISSRRARSSWRMAAQFFSMR